MGTGGLVVFQGSSGEKKEIYLQAHFHSDGDYSSLGVKLAKFLHGVSFTNGLSGLDSMEAILMNPDLAGLFPAERVEEVRQHRREKQEQGRTVCNGLGCLVAQFVAQFKHGPGGLYIRPASLPLVDDFVYVVDCDESGSAPIGQQPKPAFRVTTWQGKGEDEEQVHPNMTLAAFGDLCGYGLPAPPAKMPKTRAAAST
eukprot:Skav211456  [mRNA]  locus=scaffold379:148211:148804:- [translate_table: standard]